MNRCAILVNSCDAYEDIWGPFFSLFEIMWKNCPYPIYLNTETKKFNFDRFSGPVVTLNPTSASISWSKRLRQILLQIDEEYILMFLEDFFLMSPVREDMIEKCIDWMNADRTLACIRMENCPIHEEGEALLEEEFYPIKKNWDFTISTQTALWRKDFLLNILRDDESAWDFEGLGSARYNRKYQKQGYKIVIHSEKKSPIFDYSFLRGYGYGIVQGKWQKKNVELFEKNGIEVDFGVRGFIEDQTDDCSCSILDRVKNRWNSVIRSLKKKYKP